MIRGTIILMALAVLVSGTSQEKAAAQPRKGLPKWEYATLNYMENDAGSFAAWIKTYLPRALLLCRLVSPKMNVCAARFWPALGGAWKSVIPEG